MFCHICGTQIADGAMFCHKCGTKVVYDGTGLQAPDTELKSKPNVWASFRKSAKMVFWISVPIIIVVLIGSGVLQNIFDTLMDINREIENQAAGATTVSWMQSAADTFPSDSTEGTTGNSSESSFAWVEEAHMVTEGDFFKTRYIVGAIENVSDITFVSASVKFILYDSDGNQIDTTSDYISNFKAGNTWRFKAIVLSDDVVYFEFLHATKTYP